MYNTFTNISRGYCQDCQLSQ